MARRMATFTILLGGLVALGLFASGCSPTTQDIQTDSAQVLAEREAEIAQLQAQAEARAAELARAKAEAEANAKAAELAKAEAQAARSNQGGDSSLLPPNAQPGECYARVLVPPVYETRDEQVLVREASEKINVEPAKYEWGSEQVLVKEEQTRLEVVPATYGWVEEQVMVKPERTELKVVPAQYRTETEKVLVSPARTYWKKGRGAVEKIDDATGEIMCLVEEPAVYKTVSKQVLVKPETVEEVTLPAEYATVKKMVQKTPPTTKTVTIPAEYKTVKVRKEVAPATRNATAIPAEYGTVTQKVMVQDAKMEWRPVLCETNFSQDLVMELQRALQAAGHDPGPIDGRYGRQTRAAVASYQKSQGLATGSLTMNTLKSLKVRI